MALLKIEEPVKNLANEATESEVVVGIDLGTTNSLIGLVVNGKVQIFADENGNELHKSIVKFGEGKDIIQISSIKRLMGKGFLDVKNSREKFPFEFEESNDGKGLLLIKIGEKKYSAAEISAEILKYLKNLAEEKLIWEDGKVAIAQNLPSLENKGEKPLIKITKAVITVPAYFDEAAKNATKFAAQLAGLEVLRLVSEPTAAALAYGLDNSSEGIYAVYDLGGGTFDVSILKMQRGVFKVLGVSGDTALGGDDFDEILADEICGKVGKWESGKSVAPKNYEEGIGFSEAKILARKVKEELSFKHEVVLSELDSRFRENDMACENGAVGTAKNTRGENYKNNTAESYKNIIISRAEFEKLIAKKINHTITLTKNLLQELELESLDIKGVIMVGGSSRIPLIHQKMAEIFDKAQIFTNLDPDRIVAIGAAWQAFNLSSFSNKINNGINKTNDAESPHKYGSSLLIDVIPLSLGIEMMGGIVDKVILRNSAIPASVTKEFTTYADNQNGMKLHIVQGEREFAQDCRSLAQFEIKNIPPMKAGMARIAVTFKVDADGLLTVTAEEKITGAKQEVVVKPSYGIDENEVKKMLLDSMKNASRDMENRLLAQVVSDARQSALILKNDLQEFAELISNEEKIAITKKLLRLEELLDEEKKSSKEQSQYPQQTRESIASAAQELEKSAENLVLQKVNHSLKSFVGKKT